MLSIPPLKGCFFFLGLIGYLAAVGSAQTAPNPSLDPSSENSDYIRFRASEDNEFSSASIRNLLSHSDFQTIDFSANLGKSVQAGTTGESQLRANLAHFFSVYADNQKDILWFECKKTSVTTIRVEIFDLSGERIAMLSQTSPPAKLGWNIDDQVAGIVYFRITLIDSQSETPLPLCKIAVFH